MTFIVVLSHYSIFIESITNG